MFWVWIHNNADENCKSVGAGEMAQWRKRESIRIGSQCMWFTTICIPSSKGSDPLLWPPWTPGTHVVHRGKKIKQASKCMPVIQADIPCAWTDGNMLWVSVLPSKDIVVCGLGGRFWSLGSSYSNKCQHVVSWSSLSHNSQSHRLLYQIHRWSIWKWMTILWHSFRCMSGIWRRLLQVFPLGRQAPLTASGWLSSHLQIPPKSQPATITLRYCREWTWGCEWREIPMCPHVDWSQGMFLRITLSDREALPLKDGVVCSRKQQRARVSVEVCVAFLKRSCGWTLWRGSGE